MQCHGTSQRCPEDSSGRNSCLVSVRWSASVSGPRQRQMVRLKALGISRNTSFELFSEKLPSFPDGAFKGAFSEQVNSLEGLLPNMGDLNSVISQVRNGSLEVISNFFETFDIFPGHSVLNALATSFFFLCLYIFVILVPRK